jgi:transcriptional regulator with XRE-family HTH domain
MSNQQVGRTIQELRKRRGLTGEELGRKAGLSQSKISKIETGFYPRLQVEEVDKILNILDATDTIRQQIYQELELARPQDLLHRPFHISCSIGYYDLEEKSALMRVYTQHLVPVQLQTAEYRVGLLQHFGVPERDMPVFMKEANKRQDLLWNKQYSFHFLMHESLLYTPEPGQNGPGKQQMDRIERFIGIPNVKIGLIPLTAGMPLIEHGPFALWDDHTVNIASASGDILSHDKKMIELHMRAFAELDRLAVYGDEARQMIGTVLTRIR